MSTKIPKDLMTVTEARKLIGVSTVKMAHLIRNGLITAYPDPLDARVKLVSRAEVLSLRVRERAA